MNNLTKTIERMNTKHERAINEHGIAETWYSAIAIARVYGFRFQSSQENTGQVWAYAKNRSQRVNINPKSGKAFSIA